MNPFPRPSPSLILLLLCLGAAFPAFAGGGRDQAPSRPVFPPGSGERGAGSGETAAAGEAEGLPGEAGGGEAVDGEPAAGAGEEGAPGLTGDGVGEGSAGEAEAVDGAAAAEVVAGEAAPEEPSPQDKTLELDIKTSTLLELAAWCRTLGLSEGGTREEMADRLRAHFNLALPGSPAGPEGVPGSKNKYIVIESARTTEYFTLEVVDEEYARLRGDVVVNLKDGEAVHRIKAWDILYNRTRNMMTASGGVEYVKTEGDTVETFRGDSITVNLDDWSSVFMDGVSERSLSEGDTTYRFSGTVISRNEESVTVMTRADITNASNEDALWSLHASRLWLLPGSDWAILNAILKVGEIPVLYIPFFFYPADEIIFHPVLGTRSREGNFIQTTTYILGRPKASSSSESSITKMLSNNADMEKIQEGIFLRSTGKKTRDPNDTRFSVIFDAYANLGTYLGTELALPQKGVLGAVELSGGIGFTRDIYRIEPGYYSPFARFDGTSDWNRSRFFDLETPFRYRLNTKGSVAGKYGSLALSFPFYSDPYVNRDFLDRSEEMDWVSMLREGANQTQEEETVVENTQGLLGAYEWRLNGALNPPVAFLNPYVSTLSLASFTSTVSFRTRESQKYKGGVSPNRIFFFPDKLTIYSASLSIAGTPLTLGGIPASQSASGQPPAEQEDPLKNTGKPRPPWEEPPEASQSGRGRIDNSLRLSPPALNQRFDAPGSGRPQFSIDYRLSPSSASEMQFDSGPGSAARPHWMELEDVNWGERSSILTTARLEGSTGFTLTDSGGGAYTTGFRFSGSTAWQGYTFINEEAQEFLDSSGKPDQLKIDQARRRAYAASFYTTSWEHTTTLKPLYRSPVWGASNIQYTVKGLLMKNEFEETATAQEPSWKTVYGGWEEKKIDAHRVSGTISASVMEKAQTLTVAADLYPRPETLSGDLTLRAWITETSARGKILEPWNDDIPWDDEKKFDPLSLTETIRWGKTGSFQQTAIYKPGKDEWTNFSSAFSWAGFSASLTAVRARTYIFDNGWIQNPDPEEKLELRDMRFGYSRSFKQESLWDKRLKFSLNLNTSLNFDLQRYTYSRFNFTLGFTLGISHFLDLTLSTTSENAVIYRYFQDMPFFTTAVDPPPPGEKNLFVDLLNSFRFDDETLRKSSGFKLKSFKLDLTHYLGDWTAKLGITLSPYLDQKSTPYQYRFNNEISFVVQWIPISEVKTDIKYSDKDNEGKITVK